MKHSDVFLRAKAEGNKHIYFIDGAELLAGEDADSCAIDSCHSNDLGFYRMARRIEEDLASIIL